jgi:predicted MFS family arabinose efflux permease
MTAAAVPDAPFERAGTRDAGSAADFPSYFGRRRAAFLLAALFLVSAFAQIDRILPFILAEAIKVELRLSDTHIGLITGIAFALCYALLSLPMARLCDQGSPRKVLLACTLTWSAMTALGGFATGFASLAATRFGVALGEAGAVPSGHTLIARKIRPGRRGFAIGIFSMGIPVGTMVGFGLGGAISDAFGWRTALLAAGGLGAVVGILAFFAAGPTSPVVRSIGTVPFWQSTRELLAVPAFRALMMAAISIGFAAAPFYAFAATFLIRSHAFSATEAGLTFVLMQGTFGIAGTLLGGRGFDAAAQRKATSLLLVPAITFGVAAVTTVAALFVSVPWISIILFIPAMFTFAFTLPYAFGAAHLVAGVGREGIASSLAMIGSGLIGPALGPLLVGLISDLVADAGVTESLSIGLLIVPVACLLTVLTYLNAGRKIAACHPG